MGDYSIKKRTFSTIHNLVDFPNLVDESNSSQDDYSACSNLSEREILDDIDLEHPAGAIALDTFLVKDQLEEEDISNGINNTERHTIVKQAIPDEMCWFVDEFSVDKAAINKNYNLNLPD